VRVTFLKGAQLKDPKKLFNASLEGNALRAIDFHEGDTLDEAGIKALILEGVRLNNSKARSKRPCQDGWAKFKVPAASSRWAQPLLGGKYHPRYTNNSETMKKAQSKMLANMER